MRAVTGMVAFRDSGPVMRGAAPPQPDRSPCAGPARPAASGDPVTHVTGSGQLPFGRDENQPKTYDDWSEKLSRVPRAANSRRMRKARTGGVTSGRQRYPIISDGLPTQLPDIDPDETREWIDSFDSVTRSRGRGRARYLMLRLLERAREQQVGVPGLRSTDYINTIGPEREPWFPGDEYVERRIRAYIRWNAAIMVSRANRPGGAGVGGHIATYAS